MGDSIEYGDVVQEVRGAMQPGRLKLQSNSVIFKNIKTGKVETFQSSEIQATKWLLRARGQCLKVILENGTIHRFDGLKDSEYERLKGFISKYYNTSLDKEDISVKGWNWGVADFVGNGLNFDVDGKRSFELPLGNVSHATTGKNEVTIEFHQNDDAAVSLMEVRFHVPTSADATDDPVQEFYQNVLDKADIIQATGDAITIFQEIQCLTPRGRYDLKIYPTFLQLHGKTFDYKIPYTTILRLFLLPHKDGRQMFFVVSLDPPIKQGQTRYPFLILLFNKEDEATLELGLSEEDIAEKYEGKLSKEMSGPEYEIISRVMKALVNRKITVPGSFVGHSGTHCIQCSFKAATGYLYPLERGFIFVHKPPVHIRFDEVSCVNFARSSGSTRSFDFEVDTKTGTSYTFVSIDKDEYGKLYDFVTQRKLKVKNIGNKLMDKGGKDQGYIDDLMESSDEGNHDAYLERMKLEGKDRDSDALDDDTDSSDESFNPGESGSEVAEEYDSNVSTSSSSDDEDTSASEAELERRREKKAKEKAKKKTKTVKEYKPRKKKAKKDKDAPKRPPTTYMMWLNENREKIKASDPDMGVTEIAKKGGEMWKALPLEEKAVYEEKVAELKEEYQAAMKEYKAKLAERGEVEGSDSGDDESGAEEKKPKKKKSKSPKKVAATTTAGSGSNFKSKEFISASESSESDSDKPLKKKKKKEEKKKEKKEESGSSSALESLPSDHEEEILKTPPGSGGGSGSGSESESGSD